MSAIPRSANYTPSVWGANVCTIQLTQGFFAAVDEEDVEWLSQWNWCVQRAPRHFYAKRSLKGIMMHREILGRHGFAFDCVDHINHDGLDNRKANLRPASFAENVRHQLKYRGLSRYKGVHLDKKTGKWRGSIQVNGKILKSPRFLCEITAARWYNERAIENFGAFALINEGV